MLTDAAIRKAKAASKAYKLSDSGGLHLYVSPSGGKLWRLKYRFGGKEKLLSLGKYPDVSLGDARSKRDWARQMLTNGRDPGLFKYKADGADEAQKFETIAREWHKIQSAKWSDEHAARIIKSLEAEVFEELGQHNIKDITPPQVLDLIRGIEGRGALVIARKIRQRMSAVFVYAIASGKGDADPAAIIKGAMAPQIQEKQPAVTDLDEARKILKAAEATNAHPATMLGLRLLALTVVRSSELRGARWPEFEDLDGDEPLWRIPAERMKGAKGKKREHVVPLSTQAVEVIQALKTLHGRCDFVLPSSRSSQKPMSENALGYLLNRAGYYSRHVPHGWRSTFSTVMNEAFPREQQIIDSMLAHVIKDKVEAVYNRSSHLKRRRELAQVWADMLFKDMPPASVLLP